MKLNDRLAYARWLSARYGRLWFLRRPSLWRSPYERYAYAGQLALQAMINAVLKAGRP